MISTVVNDCLPEKRLFTKSSFSPLFMSALLRRVRAPVSLLSIASQLVSPSVPFLRPPYDFIATSSPNRSQSTGKAQAYRRRGENRWSALEIDWNLMQIIIKEKFLQKFIINYFSSSYQLISPFLWLTLISECIIITISEASQQFPGHDPSLSLTDLLLIIKWIALLSLIIWILFFSVLLFMGRLKSRGKTHLFLKKILRNHFLILVFYFTHSSLDSHSLYEVQ